MFRHYSPSIKWGKKSKEPSNGLRKENRYLKQHVYQENNADVDAFVCTSA